MQIFGPSDFNHRVYLLESPINLADNNSISIELASNPGSYLTIEVREEIDPPTVTLSANPGTIMVGESSMLTWSSINADTCVIEPGIGQVDPNGSISVSQTETTTYTITANGLGGTATAGVTVTATNPYPTVDISAIPEIIQIGESSTLIWTSNNAHSAYIDNGIGIVSLNGSTTVFPDHTTTYTITVTGSTGSASAHAKVMVSGNPEPQLNGSFGEQYQSLVPPDATIEAYDPKRFSIITGLVQDTTNLPIVDVAVTILDHPEYGTTITGTDGRFSIPVEGGGTITVVYQKEGLITAHRKVNVPWNDIAIAKSIVMIAEDPASTTLTFDGYSDTVVTHQSTEVTDEFGSRSFTMVFTGDNRAYLVDEGGNDVHELTTITTRATEFTTPESMPAKLPPNSAYTYCVELGVDGAQRVRFEKPVITWVDNFLGFNVGMAVPVGYYDRDRGVWVPEKNGRVVKLLDTDSNGIVDSLDADGDDQADDLNKNGSFGDEVTGLEDAQKYQPGATYWRVAVNHFTPLDLNWAWRIIRSLIPLEPYGPQDSISPKPVGEPNVDQQQDEDKDCQKQNNSFVEERSRIFHEDIPIPGTDFTLHYASNRVEGFRYLITVPASDETVAYSLKRIVVKLEVAGRTLEQILDPLPNQKAEFVWDGLDHLGRQVKGSTIAHVEIGFVYDAVYTVPPALELAFAMMGEDLTSILTRQEVTLWRHNDIELVQAKGSSVIAEGWTLSAHHYINPMDPSVLHRGDGALKRQNNHIIETVAGTGYSGFSGDGGPATEAQFKEPEGVAVDAAGNLYIADRGNSRIRKVDTNGIITIIAEVGQQYNLAVDSADNIYFSDVSYHFVGKIDTNGVVTIVAGTGLPGYIGDGGPATEARFHYPAGLAVDAAGNLYIADRGNDSIRKVDTKGVITTVAGVGTWGYGGDGGPATEAHFDSPDGIAVDPAGNLYIADWANYRIRKVDTSGIITTVAGNGIKGYSGDDGPATEAGIGYPAHVAVDSAGNLYLTSSYEHRVRKVDTSGIITTVVGNGIKGYSGDGGPATEATLSWPEGVAVDASGNLYFADSWNNRIRKVGPPSVFAGFMTAGDIPFVEDNGLGHILFSSGLHKKTIDLDTGETLYEFGYDQDNNLVSITDQFGNQITIAWDGGGIPTSITSPDGLTTTLTIDANNHLTRITYPGGSYYDFEYTSDGLMTAEIEPEGNRFEHVFDSIGRLTDVMDQEGGHWQFSRYAYENGDILTEVLSGEGNLTSYLDHTYSTGAYTSTITGPAGAETLFNESADGLTINKSLPCGMDLEFKYGVDPEYKFKYVKEMRESTPAGLEKVTLRDKTYLDTNADEVPDIITEAVTINGKGTTLVNNVLQSQKTITSPEGRTLTTLYDLATLLTTSLNIPGLYETTYGYNAKGRLTSIDINTRGTDFTYNAQGFLESITDPENHTTTYSYDEVGSVKQVNRPDNTSVWFDYDKNGNMTVLTNPSSKNHVFGYNSVNLNSSYQTLLSGSYSYVYDKDRRLIQTNFPSGNQINNIYDTTRLVQIQTPEGNIDYTYLCGTKVGSIAKVGVSPSLTVMTAILFHPRLWPGL